MVGLITSSVDDHPLPDQSCDRQRDTPRTWVTVTVEDDVRR